LSRNPPGRTLVVTGTDTGVGKTRVACALLRRARARGLRVAGFKPVASGAEATPEGLRNDDALALQAAAGGSAAYADVNPYCFAPPIAPHLAARRAGVDIDVARLDAAHARLAAQHDLVVVEGAGGWLVPLNERESFGDWAGHRGWPVMLVVAMRLGCLSHALLTVEAVRRRTTLVGWIATLPPPAMDAADDNIATLRARLAEPCWGVVATGADDLRPGDDGFERWLKPS
jgi:dethiobiotin synthetase